MMKRVSWVVATAVVTLFVAGSAWASASELALRASGRSLASPNPEPTAALLFGIGTGVVAWRLSRKQRS